MAGKLLITPNNGSTTAGQDPTIRVQGTGNSTDIIIRIAADGSISFEGTNGQLFSISDDMSGTIFSVNDVSGIPSLEVLDTGLIKLAQYSGNVVLGSGTDNGTDKLQITGTINTTGAIKQAGNQVLHAGNYTSYSPTLTGGSASGTWNISVSGSASSLSAGADRTKLDGIAASANNYSHPANHPPAIITQDASNRFVTDTEKATWNAKQAALGFTPYNATNPSGYTSNTGTVTGVTGTAPVVSSGGTAPAISMAAATASVNGYMTSTYAAKLNGIAAGATANTGTVTSVGGTGSYGGLTLTGTVTTTGNLTLGGTPTGTWPISVSGASTSCSGNAASASYTPLMSSDTSMLFGRNGLQYFNVSGLAGDVATTTNTPTGDWWHILRGNHGNAVGYYTDLALPMTADTKIRYRRISAGVTYGWNTVLDSTNYNSYSPTLTGVGASGTWGISITGSSTACTGNANQNTASGSNAPLQAYGTDSGAMMSFHRGGYYAINMGLDSDNVFRIGGWSAGANRLQMDMSGNLMMAGNVTAYSDERLKKDWEVLPTNFIEKLSQVKVGTFTRIDSDERQVGVSAQSLITFLPEAVQNDGEYLSVAYGNAALASAVELAKEVVSLNARIARLEALVSKLIEG